jgi:hypothetical protein
VLHDTDAASAVQGLRVTLCPVLRVLFAELALTFRVGACRKLERNSDAAVNREETRCVSEYYIEARHYRLQVAAVPWNFAAMVTVVASAGMAAMPAAALPCA